MRQTHAAPRRGPGAWPRSPPSEPQLHGTRTEAPERRNGPAGIRHLQQASAQAGIACIARIACT